MTQMIETEAVLEYVYDSEFAAWTMSGSKASVETDLRNKRPHVTHFPTSLMP